MTCLVSGTSNNNSYISNNYFLTSEDEHVRAFVQFPLRSLYVPCVTDLF
uniref:Uncharacterized protein n=1 Tax=Anguilla anguilla TaxID=7936 RepID=A0A0E9TQZ2_ANGAN